MKKCPVCGKEIEDKYQLCFKCNEKYKKGVIIRCEKCGKFHYSFLYTPKERLISDLEHFFYESMLSKLPPDYRVFPQINLAAFIERTDNSKYRNELFRNVDFLITDVSYAPQIVIEINGPSHDNPERRERDLKVAMICQEAGIPILTVPANCDHNIIVDMIMEKLSLPINRTRHFGVECPSSQNEYKQSTAVHAADLPEECPSSQKEYRRSIFGRMFGRLFRGRRSDSSE